MANEIKSIEDARARLKDMFGPGPKDDPTKKRLRDERELDDYARIAHFLSQNKEVQKTLAAVSAGIWDCYREPAMEAVPNRFSQAIVKYASHGFGFSTQGNVVFIGPLGGPEFMSYVRDGVLWKDTFAPGHGEFSHSFQWLAAGLHLKLGPRTAVLYKRSADIFSNRKLSTRDTQTDDLTQAVQPLWAWLVDCFNPGKEREMAASGAMDHAYSKTCRVPNNINNLAGGQHGWFINLYIAHRRDWLKQIAVRGQEMRQRDQELTDPGSRMEGIIKYQGKSYGRNTDWERNAGSGNVLLKTTVRGVTKGLVEMSFHGQKGMVSKRALDAKQMIS